MKDCVPWAKFCGYEAIYCWLGWGGSSSGAHIGEEFCECMRGVNNCGSILKLKKPVLSPGADHRFLS
jgi:hypothetical protein